MLELWREPSRSEYVFAGNGVETSGTKKLLAIIISDTLRKTPQTTFKGH